MPAAAIAAGAMRRTANRPPQFSSATRANLGEIAASAQVKAEDNEPYTGPLRCDLVPTVVKVDVEWIPVTYPSKWTANTDETSRAAIRAQLVSAADYGPPTHVAAMVVDGDVIRTIVLEGSVGAVRQAFPDQDRLIDLARAGATEFLAWGYDQRTRRTVERVGVFRAPRPLQMELETRGLAARISALAALALA